MEQTGGKGYGVEVGRSPANRIALDVAIQVNMKILKKANKPKLILRLFLKKYN